MNPIDKVGSIRFRAPLLAGPVYALVFMCVAAVVVSLLLAMNGMKEESLTDVMYVIHALSSLTGGIAASRRATMKGWYYGGLSGLLYALIVLLTGFLAFDAPRGTHSALIAGVAFLSGALGGIIGINLKK